MQKTFEENPFFEVHAFSHYFSKALGGVAFKNLDHAFDLALSIASMDAELFKSSFVDLKNADMETVWAFIDSLDDQAMTALSFIIKMAEIEPYLIHTEETMDDFKDVEFEIAPDCPETFFLWCPDQEVYDFSSSKDAEDAFQKWQQISCHWMKEEGEEEERRKIFFADLKIYSRSELLEKAKGGDLTIIGLGYFF